MAKRKKIELPVHKPQPQWIGCYTQHPEGGCADIGEIRLNDGWVLLSRKDHEDLLKARARLQKFEEYAKAVSEETK